MPSPSASLRMKPPSFSVSVTTASQLHDAIDRLLPLLRADASHAPAARALAAAAAASLPPSTLLSNRLLHLLSSHAATLPDALALLSSLPHPDVCSYNTLVAALSRSPRGLASARALFDQMPRRDHFSWSAIVSAHARHGQPHAALALYRRMLREPGSAGADNQFTASSALAAAAAARCAREGMELHCHVVRRGIDADVVIWSALADMYAKCGRVDNARSVFDRMPVRDVVSWTAMLERYFDAGRGGEGFKMFVHMLRSGVRPNEFTYAGVLRACAEFTSERLGRQVHGRMAKSIMRDSCFGESALLHMYSKCGDMGSAVRVFEGAPKPDLVSWTAVISGYAQNGQPEEALHYFDMFLRSGIRPDHVMFVGVLSACVHAGLVDKGLKIFHLIKDEYGIEHTADHYACVIDLLSRSGQFEPAEEMINKMSVKPNKFLWASLLGGCRIHKNVRLARWAAEALFEIEPDNSATYVTLANIYASVGLFDEVENVRRIMESNGISKMPASSWIEVGRRVHVFLVGDKTHPQAEEIYALLRKLFVKMREEGYVADTGSVLHDVEDEQKEQDIGYHSERLAVAFGIIATPQGAPIKVFKNLRICGDCHTTIKFISQIVQREIIVRDSNRFHHFKNGSCSCRDYW
ncbi:pentatricopeptide repeat-containing protein At4g37170 [Phragmites australis]|uniref:pentatricopeptide repeat-containing protein At4g37170 n=1 Tax=Phragmites australis TaxID=29695 RepID=UPI002D7767E2|nr:pentatricopeptide repeat-containing protein At4g37170 [Phragmites australis]